MIHKVDPKQVSRNGKRASSFVVPLRTPAGPGQRTAPGRPGFDSQEDLFKDREEYFEQATPYGDTLYTPAPLIGWFHDFRRTTRSVKVLNIPKMAVMTRICTNRSYHGVMQP